MLADCGFDVTVSLGALQAILHLPTFTKGVICQQQRLSKLELLPISAHMWNVLLALSSKGFQFFKAFIIADSFLIRQNKGEKASLID